jgi:hypothetical protein
LYKFLQVRCVIDTDQIPALREQRDG